MWWCEKKTYTYILYMGFILSFLCSLDAFTSKYFYYKSKITELAEPAYFCQIIFLIIKS